MDFNALQPVFAGRHMALVGTAQSIFGKKRGLEIEAYNVVMGFNYGEIKSPRDQG